MRSSATSRYTDFSLRILSNVEGAYTCALVLQRPFRLSFYQRSDLLSRKNTEDVFDIYPQCTCKSVNVHDAKNGANSTIFPIPFPFIHCMYLLLSFFQFIVYSK